MHVYSIDKDIRTKVVVALFVASIFISMILQYFLREPIEIIIIFIRKVEIVDLLFQAVSFFDVLVDVMSVPTIYAILSIWFDKKLWKIKCINDWLGVPDLNGTWSGTATSSYRGNSKYSMKLKIKQTWNKISFIAVFPDTHSKSESNCASFFIESNGDKKIGFGFINRSREVNSQQYDGYNILELDSKNEISGRYFNNRDNSSVALKGGNKGQFELKRIQSDS